MNEDFLLIGTMIQQGSVCAPLEWRIFWDTLLCVLEDQTEGFTFKAKQITKMEKTRAEGIEQKIKISASAFVEMHTSHSRDVMERPEKQAA